MSTLKQRQRYRFPFLLVTSLFFLWGFAISMLDVLNKHFQDVLHVTKAQSGLVQLAVYGAYFLVALPAGRFLGRYGYRAGILLGLMLYATGAFLFYPATQVGTFAFFLLALFIIACGLAFLETAANPYVTVLGPPEGAAQRLNLSQSFNGLGVILGPLVGGLVIFNEGGPAESRLSAIQWPYVVTGAVVVLVALLFSRVQLPEIEPEADAAGLPSGEPRALLAHRHFAWGVVAQFFYVGAQAGVWGFFINYATEEIDGLSNQSAAFYLSVGMVLYTLGRFSSIPLMRFIQPARLLAGYAGLALLLTGLVVVPLKMVSLWALIGICFCMSIMFPTIFALGVGNLGGHTKRGGAVMIMSIVGGAVIPPLMGLLADRFGTATAFCLPAFCFLTVLLYARSVHRPGHPAVRP